MPLVLRNNDPAQNEDIRYRGLKQGYSTGYCQPIAEEKSFSLTRDICALSVGYR